MKVKVGGLWLSLLDWRMGLELDRKNRVVVRSRR